MLLFSAFLIAACGLIYELIAGTVSSYLLGDSVTQFSRTIGVYLFAMGVGSWLSGFVSRGEARLFVQVQFLIGAVGGSSAAALFVLFTQVNAFRPVLYGLIFVIGTLVGLEIPLLLRILKDRLEFKDLVARVFTFDYIGALLASLLFPLVLVPHLGLVRSSFLFGMLNVVVGILTARVLRLTGPWATATVSPRRGCHSTSHPASALRETVIASIPRVCERLKWRSPRPCVGSMSGRPHWLLVKRQSRRSIAA